MKSNKTLTYLIIILSIITLSCNNNKQYKKNDKIIVQIKDKKLYKSKIKIALPKNISKEDSITFTKNYIKKWICNQLILNKAEMYLDENKISEVDMMLEYYRTSLMVFNYQQMIISEKLDTIVSQKEIIDYYSTHNSNFKLDSCVVKAIYVKIPKSVPDKYKLKRWIRSSKEKDLINIEDYCYQNAYNFDMGENWIYFNTILRLTPKTIENQDDFLKYNNFIEASDSLYTYYLQIKEAKLTDENKPIEFVYNQIKSIILNHRKTQLINKLENNIYEDAVSKKEFTIYNN